MTAIPRHQAGHRFRRLRFLGRQLVRALAKDGWRIRVAVRRPEQRPFPQADGPRGPDPASEDATSPTTTTSRRRWPAPMRRSIWSASLRNRGSQRFERLHADAAERIARAAAQAGVAPPGARLGDRRRRRRAGAYFRTKWEGEQRVREAYPGGHHRAAVAGVRARGQFLQPLRLARADDAAVRAVPAVRRRHDAVPAGLCRRRRARRSRHGVDDPAAAGQTYELGGPEVMTLQADHRD